MRIVGQVVDAACRPISGALLDFWQSDDRGRYDNQGYLLRGHQYANAKGEFRLDTLVPGEYPGRTRTFMSRCSAEMGRCSQPNFTCPITPETCETFCSTRG